MDAYLTGLIARLSQLDAPEATKTLKDCDRAHAEARGLRDLALVPQLRELIRVPCVLRWVLEKKRVRREHIQPQP